MPTALSDPSTALYGVLLVAALVLGMIALRRQRRSDVINFAVPAAALLAVFLIDRFVESPRESIVRVLREMEAASQNKDYDGAFKHISDDFKYQSTDKRGLREKAQALQALSQVEGIKITNADRRTFNQKDDATAEQVFDVMPLGVPGNTYRYEVVGTFRKEKEQWRLIGVVFKQDGQVVTPPGL
jgi:MYXO-CTERM domain-containing protein